MISVVILDRWEMAGRTLVVLEHPTHKHTSIHQTIYNTNSSQNQMAGGWLWISQQNTKVLFNGHTPNAPTRFKTVMFMVCFFLVGVVFVFIGSMRNIFGRAS